LRVLSFVVVLLLVSVVVLLVGVASGVMVSGGRDHVSFSSAMGAASGYAFLVRGSRVYVDVNLQGNVSGSLVVAFRDLVSGEVWSWSTRVSPGVGVVGPVFIVPHTGFYGFTVRVEGGGSVGVSGMITCEPGPEFREGLLHRVLWGSLPVLGCCLALALVGLLLRFAGVKWVFAELASWEVASSFKAYAAFASVVFVLLCFVRVGNYVSSSLSFGGGLHGVEYVLLLAALRAIHPPDVGAFMVTCTVFAVGLAVLAFNHDVESGVYRLYLSLGFGRGRTLAAKAVTTALLASAPLTAYFTALVTVLLGPSWLDPRPLTASLHAVLVSSLLLAALLSLAFLAAALPLKPVYSLIIALLVGLTGLKMLGMPSLNDLMLAAIADPSVQGLTPALTPYLILLAAVLAGLAFKHYLMDYG